jgi:hypothetical protein
VLLRDLSVSAFPVQWNRAVWQTIDSKAPKSLFAPVVPGNSPETGEARLETCHQYDDKEHLLLSCESTKDRKLRFAGLHMSGLRDLRQCEDVGRVSWFVHECMERVDNSHSG